MSAGNDTGVHVVDINGDGLPDVVQASTLAGTTTRAVWLNTGAGWTASNVTLPVDLTNTTYQDTGARFLDIDGDGLPDLVQNLVNTP